MLLLFYNDVRAPWVHIEVSPTVLLLDSVNKLIKINDLLPHIPSIRKREMLHMSISTYANYALDVMEYNLPSQSTFFFMFIKMTSYKLLKSLHSFKASASSCWHT